MELLCSNCYTPILPENINIATDLAKCHECSSILSASELLNAKDHETQYKVPNGSKILLNKGFEGGVELIFPKKGFSISVLFQFIFPIVWIGFISFWTLMAAQASIIPVLFSIPFWIVGFIMLANVINSISEVETIKLERNKLYLNKSRVFFSKNIELNINDIESIKMMNYDVNQSIFRMLSKGNRSFKMGNVAMPAIVSGIKEVYFFQGANNVEKEWVTNLLHTTLKRLKQYR